MTEQFQLAEFHAGWWFNTVWSKEILREPYSDKEQAELASIMAMKELVSENGTTQAADVAKMIASASEAVADGDYAKANRLLGKLETTPGEDDPDVTRIRSLISFMEGDD